MTITFNTKVYTADSYQKDLVGYIGALKTVTVKDDFKISRQAPKPTLSFSGLGRASAKLTRTLTLTGALTPTGDAIIEVSVAVPVGFATADVDALLNDVGALVSGADMKTIVKTQKVSF